MSIINSVIDYAERGLCCVPLNGKVPFQVGWQRWANCDENILIETFSEKDWNVGVQMGPKSGIIDIEYDTDTGKATFDRIIGECHTPTYKSVRSTHKLFKFDPRLEDYSVETIDGLEIRVGGKGAGVQSVFPPSIHPESGKPYEWLISLDDADFAEVPQVIIDMLEGHRNKTSISVAPSGDIVIPDGERHRWAVDWMTRMRRDYGMSEDQLVAVVEAFFKTQSEPATIDGPRGMREAAKWAVENIAQRKRVDLSALEKKLGNKKRVTETTPTIENPGKFPKELMKVPGLIGDVVEYNLATARKPQPELALAASIALQGALSSRKIQDDGGTRTAVFVFAVAATGQGKDHAIGINQKILETGGMSEINGGGDFGSEAGLVQAISKQPNALFQLDELGDILKAITHKQASEYIRNVPKVLKGIMTSQSRMWYGKCYADSSKNVQIPYPGVTVHGVGVPRPLFQALSMDQVDDGLLGRVILFEGRANVKKQRKNRGAEMPDAVVEAVRRWKVLGESGGNLSEFSGDPLKAIIHTDDDADDIFFDFDEECEKMAVKAEYRDYAGPWWRGEESARRLALIYACSKCYGEVGDARVCKDAAKWGTDVARYLITRMLYLLSIHMSESDFDQTQMDVYNWIAGQPNGEATPMQIGQRWRRLKPKERNEVLFNLVQVGFLHVNEELTDRGPNGLVYKAIV